jgi:GNAT superfamily N-acetyltransferase
LNVAAPTWPHVRLAVDADSPDVIGLIGSCWSEYPGCVMDVHGECPELLAPARAYRQAGGAFWVAVDRCETVVATIGWRPLGSGAIELERLYVHHRWRRRGVASALADLVEHIAGERGATQVQLWSDTRFREAHRFYRQRGYAQTGPDRDLGDLSRTREHHFVKTL